MSNELLGSSAAMTAVRRLIEQVGPTEATVLIRGERGVGKELIAAALHRASGRRDRPLVAINCAALPVELLASELFGHERGAFTGAIQRSHGLLAAAQGGTVFLDEIGDLSLTGQAMLLRVLQQREVRRLGSAASTRIDVRVLAATNVDLETAVRDRSFRADLFDRLNEVAVLVPPLRERVEDLRPLAFDLVRRHALRHGRPVPRFAPDALQAIENYGWPGNVRELEHAISRAVIFSERGWIRAGDLGLTAPEVNGPIEGLSDRQRDILNLATRAGGVRCGELIRRYGVSGETARRELVGLVRIGLLRRDGSRGGSRYAPEGLR